MRLFIKAKQAVKHTEIDVQVWSCEIKGRHLYSTRQQTGNGRKVTLKVKIT